MPTPLPPLPPHLAPRSPYQRGGIVTQHKGGKTLAFKPLARALEEPGEFLLSDFSKVGSGGRLRLIGSPICWRLCGCWQRVSVGRRGPAILELARSGYARPAPHLTRPPSSAAPAPQSQLDRSPLLHLGFQALDAFQVGAGGLFWWRPVLLLHCWAVGGPTWPLGVRWRPGCTVGLWAGRAKAKAAARVSRGEPGALGAPPACAVPRGRQPAAQAGSQLAKPQWRL